MFKATVKHLIPFHDIDIMHIVWHGNYFKYFEQGRTALMQSVGLDWPYLKELGIAMPIVDATAKYRKALTYNESIWISASIKEYIYPALEIYYEIGQEHHAKPCITGVTRQVYLDIATRETLLQVPANILSIFEREVGKS